MRRFWFAVILGLLLPSAVWLAGVQAQLGQPTPQSRWVFEVQSAKAAIAAATPGPRVLIVAGSSALFGLDSTALAQGWGRPVVNLAVNAGLGLPYILWHARQVAVRGDIVLLPLEYALYVDPDRPNAQIVDHAIARDRDYWASLPSWRRAWFAASLAPERWWQGLRRPTDRPVGGGLYGGHHIDAAGDQTATGAAERTEADQAGVAASVAWNYGARAARSAGGFPALADFASWARGAGICLAAVPPPLLQQPRYADDPVERGFYDALPARVGGLGIAYLGRPRDFMYPAERFFNTDYHLHDEARRLHTARLLAVTERLPDCR